MMSGDLPAVKRATMVPLRVVLSVVKNFPSKTSPATTEAITPKSYLVVSISLSLPVNGMFLPVEKRAKGREQRQEELIDSRLHFVQVRRGEIQYTILSHKPGVWR